MWCQPQEGYLMVRQFQYLGWAGHRDVPASRRSFLKLILQVDQWQREVEEEVVGRTIVHCLWVQFFFSLFFLESAHDTWHMTLRSLCITLYSCLCAEMEVGAVESSVPAASCVRCPRDRGWWMFSTLWRLWGTANLTWWTLRWASLERRKSENRAGFMIGGKFFLLNAEDVTGNEN